MTNILFEMLHPVSQFYYESCRAWFEQELSYKIEDLSKLGSKMGPISSPIAQDLYYKLKLQSGMTLSP